MKILSWVKRSIWQKQKFAKQIQQRKENLLTAIFKRTMGIYTHIDDIVSRDTHGICEFHCASHSDAGETCVAGLSSLSASTRFHPIWRLPMMQVGEIPSSYSYLIISLFRLVFYTVALFIYKYSIQCVRCTLLLAYLCLLYTSPSPRDMLRSRMPSSA